jgi:7,8-dihydropterin-6-yl-methyl-4-(beta-D-ribofuranosyl)aminobenzene 5'-phosphate synthase
MLFGSCNCHSRLPMSRRRLLCAGGGGFVLALIGTLAGSARTARAQALGSRVPEVDRVAVRIVTDNQVIQFIPSEKRGGLAIEPRTGANLSPDAPPQAALHGEWGLSMHAESQRGNEMRNVLVDFGYTPETLINNMSLCSRARPRMRLGGRSRVSMPFLRKTGRSIPISNASWPSAWAPRPSK